MIITAAEREIRNRRVLRMPPVDVPHANDRTERRGIAAICDLAGV
jgi:hypothetical protein